MMRVAALNSKLYSDVTERVCRYSDVHFLCESERRIKRREERGGERHTLRYRGTTTRWDEMGRDGESCAGQ